MDIEYIRQVGKTLPDGERRRMLYRAYKQNYADCTTVPDTYDSATKTIEVIVPPGRMKPSGTRGQRFCFFADVKAKDENGKIVSIGGIKALTWENACKQVRKMGYEPIV